MSESDYQRGLRGAEYNGSISDFERWNDWITGRDERERLQDISDEALIMQTLTPAEQIARIDARVAARKAKEVAEEIARLERRVHERERSHNDEVKGLFLTAVFLLFLLVTYLFPFKTDSGPGGRLFAWCAGCLLLSLYFWWTAARRVRFPLGSNVSRRNVNSPDKGEAKPQPKVFGILVVTLFSILFWLGFELKSGRLNLDANSPEVMRQILFGRPFSGIQLQAVNPLVVVALTFAFAWTWQSLARRGRDPEPLTKMSIGLVCLGVGFITLAIGLSLSKPISPAWFIWLYIWHSIGELFFEPIGQGFVIANAPDKTKALFLAIWEATTAIALVSGAWASHLLGSQLYTILGIAAIVAGLALSTLRPFFHRWSAGG